MEIVNPKFKINTENNIFIIRKKEYQELESQIREILKPAEELGFAVMEFGIKDSRTSSGELEKSLKRNLVIKLQKGPAEIDLSMYIPKLIDDNYITISGRKKIPQFQLFDTPIVTRGETIKIRTNVANMIISKEKDFPYIYLTLLGKKIPLSLMMLAYYGFETLNQMYGLTSMQPITLNNQSKLIDYLMFDLKDWADGYNGEKQEEYVKEVGSKFSSYDATTKGEDLLYCVDLIPKVDIMSKKLFKTPNLMQELVYALSVGGIDDTDYQNKRVRCFEYLVLARVAKAIFDLCMSNRTAKQPKFNINSNAILSECNVSDIVQFDFSINPIDELTKLSRASLLGPGGFNRENVPEYLRDVCPSMFGRVCSVDTPDRDNCGILQNLIPNVDLDENLKFTDKTLDKTPISIPVSMVPFLEHDDQTRLQMSSSQMRQAIMLTNFDSPMIQSGCEGLYTDYTQFVKRAKRDGEVLFFDHHYLIVIYDNKEMDVFNISLRKIYVDNMDMMKIYVKVGDKFKAGDILAESNYCKDGKISIGKNLLTGVMIYYGKNYEDGIVISDRLVKEKVFTSIHYTDLSFVVPPDKVLLSLEDDKYKPLPEVNLSKLERIGTGEPYAIMKGIPEGPIDFCSIFEEPIKLNAKRPILITDVDIYANKWHTGVPEWNAFIENKINEQKKREKKIQDVITKNCPKDVATQLIKTHYLDRYSNVGKYKVKGEEVNGVLVNLYGMYAREIKPGDKIANRHGNKGVITEIIPHESMPQLADGRHVDICINPLSIISRMNVGQLFELHLSKSLEDLKLNLLSMIKAKKGQRTLKKYLLDYIDLIDRTEDKWYSKQFKEQLGEITEDFVNNLCLIQAPFESVSDDMVKHAMEYTNTPYVFPVYDPISKSMIQQAVSVGYMYFFRMVHIAESRLAARGIASYSRRTMQPLGGRKNKGGQRMGEMETACLIAHDAPINLFEFLTTKSDCIDLKNKYIRDTMETNFTTEPENPSIVPESVKLLNAYITVIGIKR